MQAIDKLNILLLEDEEADAALTRQVLSESQAEYEILWVTDGEQALQALESEGDYAEAVRPDVILLDLNVPKTDGHEVLRKIKSNASLKAVPVFILTQSSENTDIERSFLSWADTYIVKPLDLNEFESALEQYRAAAKVGSFSGFDLHVASEG